MRDTPSSVAFCTTSSRRSPLVRPARSVTRGPRPRDRAPDDDDRLDVPASGLAEHRVALLPGAVAQGDPIARPQAQHAARAAVLLPASVTGHPAGSRRARRAAPPQAS